MIDQLLAIAEETGKAPAQVALHWVMNRPGITAPIIGVRTLVHLEDNLGASGWMLTAEQMDKPTWQAIYPGHIPMAGSVTKHQVRVQLSTAAKSPDCLRRFIFEHHASWSIPSQKK